jgi:hypothetical protein
VRRPARHRQDNRPCFRVGYPAEAAGYLPAIRWPHRPRFPWVCGNPEPHKRCRQSQRKGRRWLLDLFLPIRLFFLVRPLRALPTHPCPRSPPETAPRPRLPWLHRLQPRRTHQRQRQRQRPTSLHPPLLQAPPGRHCLPKRLVRIHPWALYLGECREFRRGVGKLYGNWKRGHTGRPIYPNTRRYRSTRSGRAPPGAACPGQPIRADRGWPPGLPAISPTCRRGEPLGAGGFPLAAGPGCRGSYWGRRRRRVSRASAVL